jgi:periplasmic divalent cation tolerance protein
MLPTHEHVIVLCTAPDDAVASRLARGLVESRLAACVNRFAAMRSTYVWEGETKDEDEVQLVIKTHRDRLDAIGHYIAEHHPYAVPELIAVPLIAGSVGYLAYIDESTRAS